MYGLHLEDDLTYRFRNKTVIIFFALLRSLNFAKAADRALQIGMRTTNVSSWILLILLALLTGAVCLFAASAFAWVTARFALGF